MINSKISDAMDRALEEILAYDDDRLLAEACSADNDGPFDFFQEVEDYVDSQIHEKTILANSLSSVWEDSPGEPCNCGVSNKLLVASNSFVVSRGSEAFVLCSSFLTDWCAEPHDARSKGVASSLTTRHEKCEFDFSQLVRIDLLGSWQSDYLSAASRSESQIAEYAWAA